MRILLIRKFDIQTNDKIRQSHLGKKNSKEKQSVILILNSTPMSLSEPQKQSLLQQLYHLSTDTQLLPYLDTTTTHRINKLLESSTFNYRVIDSMTPSKNTKHSLNMNKKKYKTQMQEIQEINQQYEQKFAHLFANDEESECKILREIDVQLNLNSLGKPKMKSNNFMEKLCLFGSNPTKSHQISMKPNKQPFTKAITKKQNMNSLKSTHSNLFHTKTNDQLITLKRRRSKEKLIFYKIKTQEYKSSDEIFTPSPNNIMRKREKTPNKNTLIESQSRSNLKLISNSPISQNTTNYKALIKRSQSQSTKFLITTNPGSLKSTSKHEKLPLLRTCESKSSLSTSKIKSASKKSISVLDATTTGTKRQLTSLLPSIEDGGTRLLKDDSGSGTEVRKKDGKRGKSNEKYGDAGIKRSHTQCSMEKVHLTGDFLEQMRVDQELNFQPVQDMKEVKKKQTKIQKPDNKEDNCQWVVTQILVNPHQSYHQYFQETQQESQPWKQQNQRQTQQQELEQDQPIICFDEAVQGKSNKSNETGQKKQNKQKKIANQIYQNKTDSYEFLKRIVGDITQQRQEKMGQKFYYQRLIAQLKEKILHQKKNIESTLLTNSKLQNQLHSLTSTSKSASTQRTLLARCISQTRKQTIILKHSLTKNQILHQKLISQELKQQLQLIEMYENVIDELKSQIKEQFRKKLEAKNELELCHKKKEGKLTKFNSTLLSSQKLKLNLTDAFRGWI